MKYGPDQPRMRTLFTQWTSDRYFTTIVLYTVINWLNDYEDMKLVLPIHVVLFH